MPRTTRVCGLTLLDAVPRPVTMARMNRILIVDDNAGFRLQARALLEADGFDVVGESTDGLSGLRTLVASDPTSCCSISACPMSRGSRSPDRWPTMASHDTSC